ncbi:MAG: formate dehydrogenase accessory sulfurtransferase FdhD [Limnochordia bacterium]|mgnify:CR=1 FL=1
MKEVRALDWVRGRADDLAAEIPLTIAYNGRPAASLLCMPTDLKPLVLGWLFTQGLVASLDEVQSLGVCADLRQAQVLAKPDRWEEKEAWRQVLTSGCGGGTILLQQLVGELPSIASSVRWEIGGLQEYMRESLRAGEVYRRCGGVHGAALAGREGLLAHAEDIGRHNAVDKVIGHGLLLGTSFPETAILTTGRVSSEMVIKAAQGGISLIGSLSVPTRLAVEIAAKVGLCLVGRLCSYRPVVYSGAERLA